MTRARETADLLTAQEVTGNINLSGILTSGSASIGVGVTSGTSLLSVGAGITMDGEGNVRLSGNLTVDGGFTVGGEAISTSSGIFSFYPQEDDLIDSNQFDAWVGIVTMSFLRDVGINPSGSQIELRKTSAGGELIATTGISSVNYNNGQLNQIRIEFPCTAASGLATDQSTTYRYYPVIPDDVICFSDNGQYYPGVNSGNPDQNTYSFNFRAANLGECTQGGILICRNGSTSWILATRESERSGGYNATDAPTCAQSVQDAAVAAGTLVVNYEVIGDWFLPTISQLQNPGYQCRTYWDQISAAPCDNYYSSTGGPVGTQHINMTNGATSTYFNCAPRCRRAFRCVTV